MLCFMTLQNKENIIREISNEYIFPIVEIEYYILSFVDLRTIYQNLILVNKYYLHLIRSDTTYQEFKKFFEQITKNMSIDMKFISACKLGNINIAKYYILNYIKSINIINGFEKACTNGHLELSKLLYCIIKENTDQKIICERIVTFLIKINNIRNYDVIKWLYEIIVTKSMAYIDCNNYFSNIFYKNNKITIEQLEKNLLMKICINGNSEILDWLYLTGKKINKKFNINVDQEQAFIYACTYGNIEVCKKIYEIGISEGTPIDIHAQNDKSFLNACVKNHLEVVKWLYQLSIDINLPFDIFNKHIFKSLFTVVCMEKSYKIAEWVFELKEFKTSNNFNDNIIFAFRYTCSSGLTFLAKSIYSNNLPLIDIGAKKNWVFRWACRNGHLETARWLYFTYNNIYNKTLDIHLKKEWAFRWACRNGYFDIIEWLFQIEAESKINIFAKNRWAINYLYRNNYNNIVNFLCKKNKITHDRSSENTEIIFILFSNIILLLVYNDVFLQMLIILITLILLINVVSS